MKFSSASTAAVTDRPIEVRVAEPADRGAVLDLLRASLGWLHDERFESFFAWKHESNPFGLSPAWVALEAGQIVGFRTFMRWEHQTSGGDVLRTVRAVDTATRPSHQGRGIFRKLTLQALDDLRADGVAFVFNTPNDQSRPGYVKMGWTPVGRLRITARVASPTSLARMLRSRVPADLWSAPSPGGSPAEDVLADRGVDDLVPSLAGGAGLRTHLTPAYLRWRYGFGPLSYRAISLGDDVRNGMAVFRVRRRGAALECVLCEVLSPGGELDTVDALVRLVARQCGADYVLRLGSSVVDRCGYVRLPRKGPVLTWYPIAANPPGRHLGDWALTLGDVELM
jgi:GNAT superfamily N-acetyltransferase